MRLLLFLACLMGLGSSPALAEQVSSAKLPDAAPDASEPIADSELADIRGGFELEGVNITLGAQLNTYIDGQLVLSTSLNWTSAGTNSVTVASTTLSSSAQAMLSSAILAGGRLSAVPAGTEVYFANGGQTALYQNVQNGVQNVLLNTAPGVNAIQTVDATIGLSGYDAFGRGNLMSSLGQNLGNAVATATLLHH